MSWRRGALLLVTALVTTGSGAACTQSCSSIGGESGVIVALRRPLPSQTVTVRVCVKESCRSVVANGIQGPDPRVMVPHPALTSERKIPVTITMVDQDGKVLVPTTTTTVAPARAQPNGPRCDPVIYDAAVTVAPTP